MLGNFCGESLSASAIEAIDRDKILYRRTNIGSIIVLLNTRLSRFNRNRATYTIEKDKVTGSFLFQLPLVKVIQSTKEFYKRRIL